MNSETEFLVDGVVDLMIMVEKLIGTMMFSRGVFGRSDLIVIILCWINFCLETIFSIINSLSNQVR